MKFFILVIFLPLATVAFGQSKSEMQDFIVQDLQKYSGVFLHTYENKIIQKEKDYIFSIQNCDLTITSKYSADGNTWGEVKVIIPIADINEVVLIPSETYGSFEISPRLQLKTSQHSMKRYWNGKLKDFGNSTIIGLGLWTNDLAKKYKSIFKDYSRFCN